jgi:Protein of unknown function (DUF3309)
MRPGPARIFFKEEGYRRGGKNEHRWMDLLGKEQPMLGTILIIFLILALVGALPRWSHSREWGYVPTGGVGAALIIVVILLLLGRL